jgi:uncharacterized protein YndB with AHSA1/START domain
MDTMTQKKQKLTLEFEIKSSPKILFNYLSNASALEEWFADKVVIRDGDYVFSWDGSEQRARIVSRKDNQSIRFKWVDHNDPNSEDYFQFDIVQDEITGDIALVVTDFTLADEKDASVRLWESQVHDLKHHIGC